MTDRSDIVHTLTALAMCAPVLVFYLILAGEALGYRQPAERLVYVAPSSFAQICSALAKGGTR